VLVSVPLAWYGRDSAGGTVNMAVKLVHLGSFSGWLGTQLWVTFFAGVTMYKVLPRHTFGLVQSKLFPKYFLLGGVLSTLSLVTFLIDNPYSTWTLKETLQVSVLGLNLVTVLANLFYFNPETIRVMFEKHKFEKKENAGQLPGKIEDDKLVVLNKNPTYAALSKRFVVLHTLAAIANLLAFCGQGVHLIYLASSI
jgi:hypothetical protein